MKFEASTIWEVPVLERGGMMRQGSFGMARNEGMSDQIAIDLNEHDRVVSKAFDWMYNGGEL